MGTIIAKGGLTFGTIFDDVIEGSDDIDTIIASLGNDLISGAGGDDLLSAGDGADTLDGGGGNDRLDGGTGNDFLAGGLGADTFLFKPLGTPGQDIVSEFNLFEDKLVFDLPGDFSGYGFDASVLNFIRSGNDLVITLDDTGLHITLQDIGRTPDIPFQVTFT
jgi:Ca2+-binding RTX toxin-like protein